MSGQKSIAILGATGSIGTNALSVLSKQSKKYKLFLLCANKNWQKMSDICLKYKPKYAVMIDKKTAMQLKDKLKESSTKVLDGQDNLLQILQHEDLDYVLSAIIGSSGLAASLATLKAGKRLMLANKESLVLAGDIIMKTKKKYNAELLPIDSEHSGLFQCLESGRTGLDRMCITASGGPFLGKNIKQLAKITPREAVNHPNWHMGDKISVDSATMINKGLEIIETHFLFNMPFNKIDVLVHPQSVVHALLHFCDGSTLAHLAIPDMRCPISYALSYPARLNFEIANVSLANYQNLSFFELNEKQFPCFTLAKKAMTCGNLTQGTLNAANEEAVQAFLNHQIGFLDIYRVIAKMLDEQLVTTSDDLEEIIANDFMVRQKVRHFIDN